jgi:ABC-type glycerol-3-phosphate transport system permease component
MMETRKRKIKPSVLAVTIFLMIFLLISGYPVFLTVITSVKTDQQVMMDPMGLPDGIRLGAYVRTWSMLGFAGLLKNSFVYSAFGTLLAVLFSIFPAYALGRFRFPFDNAVFLIILTGMMIPQQSVVIPLYEVLRGLKLLNSAIGLVLVHAVYGIPFVLLILRGFIIGIPRELEDAARVDGYGDMGLLFKIIVPLLVPSIAVASVLNIINIWKELFFSLIFLKDDVLYPLTVGLLKVTQGQFFNSWNLPAAAVLMAMLPTVVIYIVGYRLIQKGTVSGAVKG